MFAVETFLRKNFINQEKSKIYFADMEDKTEIYPKGTLEKFTSMESLVEELQSFGYVQLLKREANTYKSGIFIESGYILYWSQLAKDLKSDDILANPLKFKKLLSINQACDFLSISRPTLYKLINDNRIPVVIFMGQKRFQLSDLIGFIDEHRSNPK
jgi:excisionase family DNA binding protein